MKKCFVTVLGALFFSTLFIACEGPDGPGHIVGNGNDSTIVGSLDYEKVTDVDYHAKCICFGEKNGVHKFVIELKDADVLSFLGMIVSGSGDIYSIEIYSKFSDGLIPEMAKYEIGKNNPPYMAVGNGQSGSGVMVVDEDKSPQGIRVDVKSGYVELAKSGSDYVININVKLSDGSKRCISYTGAMATEDQGPYGREDATITEMELTEVNIEKNNIGQQVNDKTDVISLLLFGENGQGEIWLLVPKGETNLKHEYAFSDSGEPWTVYSSPGFVDNQPKPSYVQMVIKLYYLVEGKVVVSDTDVTVNAKTAKGSSFSMNYKGGL